MNFLVYALAMAIISGILLSLSGIRLSFTTGAVCGIAFLFGVASVTFPIPF